MDNMKLYHAIDVGPGELQPTDSCQIIEVPPDPWGGEISYMYYILTGGIPIPSWERRFAELLKTGELVVVVAAYAIEQARRMQQPLD